MKEIKVFEKTFNDANILKCKEGIAGKAAPYPFMNSGADKMFISSDCRIINFDNAYSIQIDSEKPSRLICTLVGQDDDYFYLEEFKDKEQAKLALRCIERRILYGYRIIDIENIKKEVEAYTEVTL